MGFWIPAQETRKSTAFQKFTNWQVSQGMSTSSPGRTGHCSDSGIKTVRSRRYVRKPRPVSRMPTGRMSGNTSRVAEQRTNYAIMTQLLNPNTCYPLVTNRLPVQRHEHGQRAKCFSVPFFWQSLVPTADNNGAQHNLRTNRTYLVIWPHSMSAGLPDNGQNCRQSTATAPTARNAGLRRAIHNWILQGWRGGGGHTAVIVTGAPPPQSHSACSIDWSHNVWSSQWINTELKV
jgi:hypothetical protein